MAHSSLFSRGIMLEDHITVARTRPASGASLSEAGEADLINVISLWLCGNVAQVFITVRSRKLPSLEVILPSRRSEPRRERYRMPII